MMKTGLNVLSGFGRLSILFALLFNHFLLFLFLWPVYSILSLFFFPFFFYFFISPFCLQSSIRFFSFTLSYLFCFPSPLSPFLPCLSASICASCLRSHPLLPLLFPFPLSIILFSQLYIYSIFSTPLFSSLSFLQPFLLPHTSLHCPLPSYPSFPPSSSLFPLLPAFLHFFHTQNVGIMPKLKMLIKASLLLFCSSLSSVISLSLSFFSTILPSFLVLLGFSRLDQTA